MDFYELNLLPNLEVIWVYYQKNKVDLDGRAATWWGKRRELYLGRDGRGKG